jgi:hypothetical protein
MSKYNEEVRKEVVLMSPLKSWVKPQLTVLTIKATYNDPATCTAENKFTGNNETFGPSEAPISCGPTLS